MKTYENFIKNLFKRKPRVKYYENGQKKSEEWIEEWVLNGKYHRVDGPAYQYWYKNGQKESEGWYLNNRRHREDGPAFINWSINGQKRIELWYLNGKFYTREKWVNQLKNIGSIHYEEQKILLNVEKYNI